MVRTAALVLVLPCLAGCATLEKRALRADIAALERRIAANEASIEQSTGDLATNAQGARLRAAYRPIIGWGALLSARPADQKTVRFQSTSSTGYLYRDTKGCWPLPKGEWYAELMSDTTKARVVVNRFDFLPVAGGLNMNSPLDLALETRVHWHIKPPCAPGGGFGGNIFVDGHETKPAVLGVRFLPVAEDKLPYELVVVSPPSLSITLQIHLGQFPTLGVPMEMKNLAKTISSGQIGLLFAKQGTFGPLPDGKIYKFELKTANPSFATDLQGLQLGTNIDVIIGPT
ncbi:hypothetical protein ACFSCW_16650 [Sphingomonas tabacisoli]|uniref:Uncharacterized protein n=1 Tax=Sphingomonas tabacisoli TaxID=2249466 RepID=A0ABW4I855_9SPHN